MLGNTIIIIVANSIFAVDVNCVQVLAPSTACGTSTFRGHHVAGEHIGHPNRQSASVIAPLFDEPSGGEYLLQCHLLYSDTVRLSNSCHLLAFAAKVEKKLQSSFSNQGAIE